MEREECELIGIVKNINTTYTKDSKSYALYMKMDEEIKII